MKTQEHIETKLLCTHYNIDISFINSLVDNNLIEVITIHKTEYIHHNYLSDFERIIRLYSDLNINIEGIDVICNLLNKIEDLKTDLAKAQDKLTLYEGL